MKICPRCHTQQPEASFLTRHDRPYGYCGSCRSEYHKKWRNGQHPNYKKDYYHKNADELREYRRKFSATKRYATLVAYSADPPYCTCCGETELLFLTLDHINNDGTADRARRNVHHNNVNLHIQLAKEGWPPGYATLCFNCNCGRAKAPGKICPHQASQD